MNTDYDKNWGSHLPVLIKVIGKTTGAVLEMGMGLYSTPFLHWSCFPNRILVSYDNNPECFKLNKQYQEGLHEVRLVSNWDEADIEMFWDVVLVDHSPSQRRIEDIKRLAQWANYIIVHDTQRNYKFADFDQIYPLFKYRYDYKQVIPFTTVLSNFRDYNNL